MLEGTGCLSARKPNFAELSEQGTPGCQLISQRRKKKKTTEAEEHSSQLLDPQCCSGAVLPGGAAGTQAGRALQRGPPLSFPSAPFCSIFLLPCRNPWLGRGAGAAAPRPVGSVATRRLGWLLIARRPRLPLTECRRDPPERASAPGQGSRGPSSRAQAGTDV